MTPWEWRSRPGAFLDNFPYILYLKKPSCDAGSFPIKFICALWLIQFEGTLGNLLTSQMLSEVRSSCGDVSSLVVVLATSIFISVATVFLSFKFSYSCLVYFFLPVANLWENITSSFLNYVSVSGSARVFAHMSAGSLGGRRAHQVLGNWNHSGSWTAWCGSSARAMNTLNCRTISPPSIYFFYILYT